VIEYFREENCKLSKIIRRPIYHILLLVECTGWSKNESKYTQDQGPRSAENSGTSYPTIFGPSFASQSNTACSDTFSGKGAQAYHSLNSWRLPHCRVCKVPRTTSAHKKACIQLCKQNIKASWKKISLMNHQSSLDVTDPLSGPKPVHRKEFGDSIIPLKGWLSQLSVLRESLNYQILIHSLYFNKITHLMVWIIMVKCQGFPTKLRQTKFSLYYL